MKYRQKRHQDYHTPVYEIDQPKHRMEIISHAPHVCIYWRIQNASNKPMKFHDYNQNNMQYIRYYNVKILPNQSNSEFSYIQNPGAHDMARTSLLTALNVSVFAPIWQTFSQLFIQSCIIASIER